MKLKDIGEFGLIEKIAKVIKTDPSVIKGIGDDCAVLKYTKGKYLLFTTDMLLEDVHFKIHGASPEEIGHKAMAVNISDIAACGGKGIWAVVAVGLPRDIELDFVDKIYSGIRSTAKRFDIDIVGGDTNHFGKIVISVALIGEVEEKRLVLRSGAKKGDIIFMTGKLMQKMRDLTFVPRVKEARFLVDNFKINSMIDISDGLLSDLGHIITESKVGACLYEPLIPCSLGSIKRALSLGEQFELLFTVNRKIARQLQLKSKRKGIKVTAIGEVTGLKGKIIFVDRFGRKKQLKPTGYKHF